MTKGRHQWKKNVFFRALPEWGGGEGGLQMPDFFGHFSRSAFLVNKKSLFFQCIELLPFFLGFRFFALLVLKWLSNLEFWRPKKKDQVAWIGVRGGVVRWFGQCPKENVFFLLMSSLRRRLSLRGSLSWPFWCLDSDSSLGFLIKRQKQLSSDREGRNGRGERCKEKAAKDDQAMSVHVQSRTVTLKEKCLNLVDRWKKIYCQV